ncbi:MAG: cupin domain-containing protein [Roseovarius sp.]|nr:cupin domain-containing protein [Roseovarius sp.]
MEIVTADARPSRLARDDWFTGRVWQDPVIEAPAPARVRALRVTFEPGARTAWHTHPLGQTLHILAGTGLVGLRGGAPLVVRPGDTVWFAPGEEHWHGAAPGQMMSHLAIQEADDGRVVDWLEQVSDADYRRPPG